MPTLSVEGDHWTVTEVLVEPHCASAPGVEGATVSVPATGRYSTAPMSGSTPAYVFGAPLASAVNVTPVIDVVPASTLGEVGCCTQVESTATDEPTDARRSFAPWPLALWYADSVEYAVPPYF